MLAHEMSKSNGAISGPFYIINIVNGINNLGGKRSSRLSPKSSTSWLNISLALVLCFLILLECPPTVTGHPASSSRSHRESKGISSTTLHSLQQGGDSGSSLSIVSSLDVLRQNMVLEIVRRRIRHAKQRNKEILDRIGR